MVMRKNAFPFNVAFEMSSLYFGSKFLLLQCGKETFLVFTDSHFFFSDVKIGGFKMHY